MIKILYTNFFSDPIEKYKVYQEYIDAVKELSTDEKYEECGNDHILKVFFLFCSMKPFFIYVEEMSTYTRPRVGGGDGREDRDGSFHSFSLFEKL